MVRYGAIDGVTPAGFYILDEPGGRQIDGKFEWAWNNFTGQPTSYAQAASMFTEGVSRFLSSQRPPSMYPYKAFTSDYALYWYDYKAGYDAVFAEMGWNCSKQIDMALCRGAAEAQNKQWRRHHHLELHWQPVDGKAARTIQRHGLALITAPNT
jgi:hypothetical protein